MRCACISKLINSTLFSLTPDPAVSNHFRLHVRQEKLVSLVRECGDFDPGPDITSINRSSRRGAVRDRWVMMSCRFSGVPLTYRDLSCPIACWMIWMNGSQRGRSLPLCSDGLMGEDFERSRQALVLSRFTQSRSDHKEDPDVKTSRQARHTWVSAMTFLSLVFVSKKSGMRARVSGRIWLTVQTRFSRTESGGGPLKRLAPEHRTKTKQASVAILLFISFVRLTSASSRVAAILRTRSSIF